MLHEKRKKNVFLRVVYVHTEYLGAPNSGQKNVFGIEEYFDGIRYLDSSPKNLGYGYKISMYRIL